MKTVKKVKIAALLCGLLLGLGLGLVAGPAAAEGEADPGAQAQARLDQALRELSTERNRIAEAKVPLSREVSKLEDEVARLRRERTRLRSVEDTSTLDLETLRRQVDSLAEQNDFIESRLAEFVRDFEGRLSIAELPRYEDVTAAAKLSGKNVNLDAEGKRETQLAVVRSALERIRGQLGGDVFAGEALSPESVLTKGRFVAFGPTVFFVSDDGEVAGLVENQLNAADPVVVALPGGLASSFASIATEGTGQLPLDPTLGRALKVEKARKTLGQYIQDGGVVGYVIIALGLAALALTAFKAFEILRFPVAELTVVDGILEDLAQGSQAAAAKRAGGIEGVAGELLQTGVRHATESRAVLEELLFEPILRVRPRLERFLPFLSITAAASPLLGLLGTVIGMINTFQLITIFGTGDAKSLSSGISEALMTTALGLIVAIPTLILHGGLSRLAKRKLGQLEEVSVAFLNGVDVLRGADTRR
ncbi:MAG: MotA/TolQ/ExbB proton channel family protein [Myxococcales bacterium]|nr:MotA/TolQ/ExbB proton channel family protein [Myxococcales bacterium]